MDKIYFSKVGMKHLRDLVFGITLHPFRWGLQATMKNGPYLEIGPISIWGDIPYSWDEK